MTTRQFGEGVGVDVTYEPDAGEVYLAFADRVSYQFHRLSPRDLSPLGPVQRVDEFYAGSWCRLDGCWMAGKGRGGDFDSPVLLRDLRSGVSLVQTSAAHGTVCAVLGSGWLAWQAIVAHDGRRVLDSAVWRRRLDSGAEKEFVQQATAPEGLSRVRPDGSVRLRNEDYTVVPGGTRPAWAGDLVVLEAPTGGLLARLTDGREAKVFEGLDAPDPRCTALPDGWYAIAAWGRDSNGVKVALVHRDEFRPPDEPRAVVAPFGRPFDAGYFYAIGDRFGDNLDAPSTCTVIVEPGCWQRSPWPVILGESIDRINPLQDDLLAAFQAERLKAAWASGQTADEVESVRDRILSWFRGRRRPPILGYVDSPSPDRPPNTDWQSLQIYPEPSDTRETVRARARRELARLPSKPITLVCGASDRRRGDGQPWINPSLVESLQSLWPEIAAEDSRVNRLLWFSDGRPGGVRDYPAWVRWHRATLAAIPGAPPIETLPEDDVPLKKPGVAITSRFPVWLRKGEMRTIEFHDRENPQAVANGVLRVKNLGGGQLEVGLGWGNASGQRDDTWTPRLIVVEV